jgi:peptidoglycan/xylan/chitin deacetylase (PgdA/CDA1 family)
MSASVARNASRPYRVFSYALHLAMLALVVWHPAWWPWALAIVALEHAVIGAASMWPRSTLLGPNWVRLPAAAARAGQVAITIDDGPDPEVTPQVLALLAEHGVKASFFLIGRLAGQYPELVAEMVRRGHSVENHSYHHGHFFAMLGPWRMARQVERGQDCLTALTGQRPRFFRPPAGLRNRFLEPILARNGLWLASWTRRGYDTRNHDAEDVRRRLLRNLAGGDILLLHDGHAAHTTDGQPVILVVLPQVLDAIAAAGLRCVTLPEALPMVAASSELAPFPLNSPEPS